MIRAEELSRSRACICFDANLKDVAQLDDFLEQTTFVNHSIIYQNGVTWSGPRTYSILNKVLPKQVTERTVNWPTGSMDHKFGEHGFAFMLCGQELRPGEYTSTNVVHLGAKFRCTLNAEGEDGSVWTSPLQDGETAALVGLLDDGSVAGIVHSKSSKSGQLIVWEKGGKSRVLPWLPQQFEGQVNSDERSGEIWLICQQ